MSNNVPLKFRSFESQILYFNGMYKLPVAAYPSTHSEIAYQINSKPALSSSNDLTVLTSRLKDFKVIILDEASEVDDIMQNLSVGKYVTDTDFLTDMADWLGDMIVYCASEMARLGIPIQETLSIIMQSNFSKLGEDGQPIIRDGKVQKGPYYWKPEPKIFEMLEQRQKEYRGMKEGKEND